MEGFIPSMKNAGVILVTALLILGCVQQGEEPPTPAPSMVTPSPPPTPPPSPTSMPVSEDEAFELHRRGWLDVLQKSETDFYCKYSFYTSRVLAVTYPEIYLKSDLIKAQSYPLEITLEMLQKYTIIKFKEIYPHGYPIFPFLDRRNFPLFLTFHSDKKEMTQIDMASAYYVMLRKSNIDAHDVFIIYCGNENTYVYICFKEQLVSMMTLRPVDAIDGTPLLIFNENDAWFPLMGRDITGSSTSASKLQLIVDEFSTEQTEPELSEFEREIIGHLRRITHDIDVDAALQLTEFSWHNDPSSIKYPHTHLHCALMLKLADYLSPIPAYLATIEPLSSPRERIQAIGDEFSRYITRHNYLKNPGDETDNTADSSYYTSTAACGPQSFPLSVALDFIGIENYVIDGNDIERFGHFWLYVKDYDLIISNLRIDRENTIVYVINSKEDGRTTPVPLNLIKYIGYQTGGLSFFWQDGKLNVEGSLSPTVVTELLTFVHERYGDDIGGVNYVNGRRELVSLEEVIEALEAYPAFRMLTDHRGQLTSYHHELPSSSLGR